MKALFSSSYHTDTPVSLIRFPAELTAYEQLFCLFSDLEYPICLLNMHGEPLYAE